MDKKESFIPQKDSKLADNKLAKNKSGERVHYQPLVGSLMILAVLLVVVLYVMICMPGNLMAMLASSILFCVSACFCGTAAAKELHSGQVHTAAQYETIEKSEKAAYILLKKTLEQVTELQTDAQPQIPVPMSVAVPSTEAAAMQTEEIIAAQKALAKVIINHSKEHADALTESGEKILEKIYKLEDYIDNKQNDMQDGQAQRLEAAVQELKLQQQKLSEDMKSMGQMVQNDMLQAINTMQASVQQSMSAMEISMQQSMHTMETAVQQQLKQLSEMSLQQQLIQTQLQQTADIPEEEPVAEMPELLEKEPVIEMPELLEEEPVIEMPELLEAESAVFLDEEAKPSELELDMDDLNFSEPVLDADDFKRGEPELTAEIIPEEAGFGESEIIPEEIDFDVNPGFEGTSLFDTDLNHTMDFDAFDVDTGLEDAVSIAGPSLAEELDLGIDLMPQEPVIEEAIAEEPAVPETEAEKTSMPDLSDPHKMMTPEEIAALLANL